MSTRPNLKIGCALWSLGAIPDVASLRTNMETVAKIGCTSVQPWAVGEHCILDPDTGSEQDRKDIVQAAVDLGLVFSSFCSQMFGKEELGGLDEEDGLAERIEKTCKILTQAVALGGPIVTTHVGIITEDTTTPGYQTLLKSCEKISKHAEQVGAYFAIETGQEHPLVLKTFLDKIDSPNLKVNFDPCNLLRHGSSEETVRSVHLLKKYIIHTHAKDSHQDTDRATCGNGEVLWDKYLTALDEIGYDGWFAIEDESGYDNVADSIAKSYSFLSQF